MATPQTLTATVKGLLDDLTNIDIYDGVPPSVVRNGVPYVIYYPNPGSALRDRLTASPAKLRWDARIVCCGWNPTQLIGTVSTIRDTLTGIRIDTGLSSSPLNEVDNSATVLESAATTATQSEGALPRYSYTLQYRLYTQR